MEKKNTDYEWYKKSSLQFVVRYLNLSENKKKDLAYKKFKLGKISKEKFISLKLKYHSEIEFIKDSLFTTAQQQENQHFTKLTRETV